ncbi:hypothetical protein BLX88_06525 [Bacillus obstructivus]|uniref:hypothetical protein n=1 Tax=Heyndrickxia oleronia TaxID=38875 RepID=UPI000903419B|nr:hypothetical protein BLX88_06525 [Bacillus obstructivus]
MEKPFKYAIALFTSKYEKILLLIAIIQIPLLVFHLFLTNFIYAVTPFNGTIHSAGDTYYGFLTLLLYLYAQIPFIKLTYNDYMGHEKPLKNAIYTFLVQGFNIFIFAIVLSFLTTIGFMLYILPGLILFSIFIPAPIIAVIDNKSVWKSLKETITIYKKHWLKLLLYILVFGLFELAIGIVLNQLILGITTSYAALVISQIFLNTLFYPFFIVLLTSSTIKWRENLNMLNVEGHSTAL